MTVSIAWPVAVLLLAAAESAAPIDDLEFLEFLAEWSSDEADWLDQEMTESQIVDEPQDAVDPEIETEDEVPES